MPAATTNTPRLKWPGEPGAAAEIARSLELSAKAREALGPGHRPSEYVECLRGRGLAADAIMVLAAWQPRREGVWWTCRAVREMLRGAAAAPLDTAALDAAQRWAASPTEEHRRAAGAAAEAANFETAAACAALAAFWSEGSLAPAGAPDVAPGPHLAPAAMASAMQLAAVAVAPQQAPARLDHCLEIGLAVAQGLDRWPETRTA